MGLGTQLSKGLARHAEGLGSVPMLLVPRKTKSSGSRSCDPSTEEVEAGLSEVQGYPGLLKEFGDRLCLKRCVCKWYLPASWTNLSHLSLSDLSQSLQCSSPNDLCLPPLYPKIAIVNQPALFGLPRAAGRECSSLEEVHHEPGSIYPVFVPQHHPRRLG